MAIAVDDIKRHYVTIAEARRMQGLRILLGAFTLPGPWHEACKGIFHAKGLACTSVRSSNANASVSRARRVDRAVEFASGCAPCPDAEILIFDCAPVSQWAADS